MYIRQKEREIMREIVCVIRRGRMIERACVCAKERERERERGYETERER